MSIHKEVAFPATPERVYDVLTNGETFAAATGKAALIGAGEGAAFSIFNGYVEGRQIELVPGERIVQAWRQEVWEPGVYSLVRFTLTRDGAGTRVDIDQDAYPQGASPFFETWREHLETGWPVFYFEPLTKYFADQAA